MNMGLAVEEPKIAFLLQLFVMIALLIGGFTRFCLMREILKQFLPSCEQIEKGKK
jgi:hypothetical protein